MRVSTQHERKMGKTPERIFLIDTFEEGEYVWCDCPDPGTEEADSVEYIRADVVEKMLKSRGEECAEKASGIAIVHEGQFDIGLAVYNACIDTTGEEK